MLGDRTGIVDILTHSYSSITSIYCVLLGSVDDLMPLLNGLTRINLIMISIVVIILVAFLGFGLTLVGHNRLRDINNQILPLKLIVFLVIMNGRG